MDPRQRGPYPLLTKTGASEMRVELDLPVSQLSTVGYPYMFPSPPTPSSPLQPPEESLQGSVLTPLSKSSVRQAYSSPGSQNAEEQSWFYYLSEIALRRIENRVLYTFYNEDNGSWSRRNICDMATIAADFEMQLHNWYVIEVVVPEIILYLQ